MTVLLLEKLGKASEDSWHEIRNLNDRSATGRNQKISFRKRGDTETRNQSVFGEEPLVPCVWRVRPRHQPEEPALGTCADVLMVGQWSGCCNELFTQHMLTTGDQKGRSWRMPSFADSWQMSVTGTKIINVGLLPVFSIHLQTQEKSDFSILFLPFLQLPKKALTCQFHSLGSRNQE